MDNFGLEGGELSEETRRKKEERMTAGGGICVQASGVKTRIRSLLNRFFFPVLLVRHLLLAASSFSSVSMYMCVCEREKKTGIFAE